MLMRQELLVCLSTSKISFQWRITFFSNHQLRRWHFYRPRKGAETWQKVLDKIDELKAITEFNEEDREGANVS